MCYRNLYPSGHRANAPRTLIPAIDASFAHPPSPLFRLCSAHFEIFAYGSHFRWISWMRPNGNRSITWFTRSSVEPLPMADLLLVSSFFSAQRTLATIHPLLLEFFHLPAFPPPQHVSRYAGVYGAHHSFSPIPAPAFFLLPRLEMGFHAPRVWVDLIHHTRTGSRACRVVGPYTRTLPDGLVRLFLILGPWGTSSSVPPGAVCRGFRHPGWFRVIG